MGASGSKHLVVVHYINNPKAAPITVKVDEGQTVGDVLSILHSKHSRRIYDGPGDGDVREEGTDEWRSTPIVKGTVIRVKSAA